MTRAADGLAGVVTAIGTASAGGAADAVGRPRARYHAANRATTTAAAAQAATRRGSRSSMGPTLGGIAERICMALCRNAGTSCQLCNGGTRARRPGTKSRAGARPRRASAHDEVHELRRHDDHLHDLLAVDVRLDVGSLARQRLELVLRRRRRGL